MARIDIEDYIKEMKGLDKNDYLDFYSLKKELNNLSESSKVFDDFERESMHIGTETLNQMMDLSSLIKIKALASQIKDKKSINDGLHTLHFNLGMAKNSPIESAGSMKRLADVFLLNPETKIDSMIGELNYFKAKLEEIKKHHSNLLPKSLDSKIKIEGKYGKHIEMLHSVHQRQKNAFLSIAGMFLKQAKSHIKSLKRFK